MFKTQSALQQHRVKAKVLRLCISGRYSCGRGARRTEPRRLLPSISNRVSPSRERLPHQTYRAKCAASVAKFTKSTLKAKAQLDKARTGGIPARNDAKPNPGETGVLYDSPGVEGGEFSHRGLCTVRS